MNARPAAKPSAVAPQDVAPFRDQRVEPITTFPLGKSACGARRVESESPRRVHRVGYEWAFLATASRPQKSRAPNPCVSVQAGGAALHRCTIMEETDVLPRHDLRGRCRSGDDLRLGKNSMQ